MTQYAESFEWCVPGASAAPVWNNFSAIGNNYISLTVKDLAALVAEIKSVIIPNWPGTRLIQDPPMQFPLRGEVGVFLLTEIISAPLEQKRAVGNAGFKALGWHPFGGMPSFRDRPDLQVSGLSAEHVRIVSKNSDQSVHLTHGDKLVLIPGYTDAMGFLHRQLYAIRQDKVEAL